MSMKLILKENKKTCLGTWLTIPSTAVAEVACQAGFDWVAVDLEHSCLTLREAEELIRVIDSNKKVPLVRLSSNDEVQIKRVMDAGAHGIIIPMVNSLSDVEKAYQSMHYPPVGKRGVGLSRAQKYGTGFQSYRKWLSESSLLIPQIEHIDAVNNIDEILSHPGVDAAFIGPYDLTASLGIAGQFDHPDYLAAFKKVEEATKKRNIPMGIHVVENNVDELKTFIDKKYNFIAFSVDFRILESSYKQAINILGN